MAFGMDGPAFRWLSIWMFLGVALGLLNKAVFQDTGLPQAALTLVHLIFTVVISWLYIYVFHSFTNLFPDMEIKELTPGMRRQMVSYSALIVLNIVLGNGTVRYLSVPLAQVIRSLVPVSTAVVAFLVIREVLEFRKTIVLVVVVVGAMCSVYGDFDNWTGFGLMIAFLGCIMASLKGTLQKKFVTGGDFSFHPIDLIYKSSVYSIPICLAISLLTEYEEVQVALPQLTNNQLASICVSGVFAGLLNISNIMATQATTAVAMAVAGNLRNALLISLSIPLFHTKITQLNSFGIITTMIGSAVFSHLSISPPKSETPSLQSQKEETQAQHHLLSSHAVEVDDEHDNHPNTTDTQFRVVSRSVPDDEIDNDDDDDDDVRESSLIDPEKKLIGRLTS